MNDYDVVIVGGGLAGCAAAITLLQANPQARVLVLERGSYPRHKVCGEFISAEGFTTLHRLLEVDSIPPLTQAPPITQVNIRVDGRVLSTAIAPPAFSITRFDLDMALWQRARELGAECRQRTTALRVSGSGPFEILTDAGQFKSAALTNAGGRWSIFNHASAGAGSRPSGRWIGLKAHFAEPVSLPTIDLYLFDGGYCGVQPIANDRVNTCAMVDAARATTLSDAFELHPELRKRSHAWTAVTETVTTAPLYFRQPLPVTNGVINIGDAAGFIDPFVGDGMTLALRSGVLAGDVLATFSKSECDLPGAARNYRRLYELRLLPAFRRARWIRQLLRLPFPVRVPLAGLMQMTGATEALLKATRIAP